MKLQPCVISRGEIDVIVKQTEGYSGADVTNLCKDAALGPIRSLQVSRRMLFLIWSSHRWAS